MLHPTNLEVQYKPTAAGFFHVWCTAIPGLFRLYFRVEQGTGAAVCDETADDAGVGSHWASLP